MIEWIIGLALVALWLGTSVGVAGIGLVSLGDGDLGGLIFGFCCLTFAALLFMVPIGVVTGAVEWDSRPDGCYRIETRWVGKTTMRDYTEVPCP